MKQCDYVKIKTCNSTDCSPRCFPKFTNTDHSFCSNNDCKYSLYCARHIKHYPQWEDRMLSYVLVDDWEKCELFY